MASQKELGQRERNYDKGERRKKHVGKSKTPEFQFDIGNPRKVIGKCPIDISEEERLILLRNAVEVDNGDRDLPAPKKLYAVHKGAIYEAQTSDHGRTYHGYPFRGKLGDDIIERLAKMADEKGHRKAFNRWVKANIKRHGR